MAYTLQVGVAVCQMKCKILSQEELSNTERFSVFCSTLVQSSKKEVQGVAKTRLGYVQCVASS